MSRNWAATEVPGTFNYLGFDNYLLKYLAPVSPR
jgi:hypothetical protein